MGRRSHNLCRATADCNGGPCGNGGTGSHNLRRAHGNGGTCSKLPSSSDSYGGGAASDSIFGPGAIYGKCPDAYWKCRVAVLKEQTIEGPSFEAEQRLNAMSCSTKRLQYV